MCIYDFLAFTFFFLMVCNYWQKNVYMKTYWKISVILLLFVMCFKSPDTGKGMGDLIHYVNLYMGKSSMYLSDEVEPGLGYINQILLAIFPKHSFFFICITSLLIICPVLWGINKYSQNKQASLIMMLVLPGIWLVLFITVRQALAQAFILWALYYFLCDAPRGKLQLLKIILLLLAAIFTHSTPYIIIPLLVIIYYLPDSNKKYYYIALIVSLFLSGIFSTYLGDVFFANFSGIEELNRINRYIENETYGLNEYGFLNFAPLTLLCLYSLYYAKENPPNWFFIKSFVLGVVLYNLLGNIPLINRAVCFFLVLGIVGAFPKMKDIKSFVIIALFSAYFIWRSWIHYVQSPHSAFLPYYFIWE